MTRLLPDMLENFSHQTRQFFKRFSWTRSSYTLLGIFVLTCGLIVYVWWPLAEEYLALINQTGDWWRYLDRLLIGNFLVMSLLIMAGADLKTDWLIIFVGLVGGLVIESWGTQTELWVYYTDERPPLWIIPAWPIASLSIDRLVRMLDWVTPDEWRNRHFLIPYLVIFGGFSILMLRFIWPTLHASLTLAALALCVVLIGGPKDLRLATLTFLAGAGLGYFLELWGTTRLCWTYYTLERPPFFAVLAHGMAAVAFWRVKLLFEWLAGEYQTRRLRAAQKNAPG